MAAFGAAHLEGIIWYLTVNNKYFRDIRILPDAECQISTCTAPFEDTEINDERVQELRASIARGLSETSDG